MGTVSRTTLNTGDILTAAQWNTQFDTIYSEFNGSIESANMDATFLATIALLADNETVTGQWTFSDVLTVNASATIAGALNVTGDLTAGGTLYGTLGTAAQPNITSLGTLTSLTVGGNVTASDVSAANLIGTLGTAAQPNITSLGTLTGLTVGGNVTATNVSAANIYGTIGTAAQGSITSLGTLTSLTISGDLTVDTNSFYVQSSNGYIGMATTSPDAPLHLDHNCTGISDAHIRITDNGDTREASIYNVSGDLFLVVHGNDNNLDSRILMQATAMYLNTNGSDAISIDSSQNIQFDQYGNGTLVTDSSGNITASSDRSLKKDEAAFERGLADVLGLEPKTYKWTKESGYDTENTYCGFIAQDVEPFIPEAIGSKKTEDGAIIEGTRTISDRPIIAALVNSVKELNKKIEAVTV